ncbi:MAG TPA: helix-turn-helix transcriptional regulator [Phycisphaerae bacterium]|nr:helix-turn-helix transcriptional regulator [Phycisphaerae bacterium]
MFYCYYDNVKSGIKDFSRMRTFDYYCLLQFVDGNGYFKDDAHPVPVKIPREGGLIVIPGARQEYGAELDCFVEDSVCFYGPAADALFNAGIIRQGIIHFGKERRLLPIIEKIRTGLLSSYLEANVMLMQLLFDLHWQNHAGKDFASAGNIEQLLQQINRKQQQMWTVKKMAKFCSISENHLRRLFRRHTGMPPKQYLEQCKMRSATELLIGTDLKIAEIAAQLGYDDPYHFIRRFSTKIGISPGMYRKQHLSRF